MTTLSDSRLQQPVSSLRGVGPRLLEHLTRLQIRQVSDLLFHLPLRYEDRSRLVAIGRLRQGMQVVVRGQVLASEALQGRRRSWRITLEEDGALLTLRFFHFAGPLARLERGQWLQCFGEVRMTASGPEMVHPEYQLINIDAPPLLEAGLAAIYPTVNGLGQKVLRRLVEQALAAMDADEPALVELLPAGLCWPEAGLPTLQEALYDIHRPQAGSLSATALQAGNPPARRRLIFEELIAHQLGHRQLREQVASWRAPVLTGGDDRWRALLASLPFALTAAQQRVIGEIADDLRRRQPMQRLVQGDVGCGKTLVAAAAVVQAVSAGYQVAIMAPTELLAEQHLASFRAWLTVLDIRVEPLSGRMSAARRRQTEALIASGDGQVIVGTHALFQESCRFHSLGLVIIDEQHRFGVNQRLALLEKGRQDGLSPHCLLMTATPIPRTLVMTAYASLDCSVIDELPPGRQAVETVVISDQRRAEVIERVRHACRQQRQVYWVCTLIETSEALQCQAAEEAAAELAAQLPDYRVALVHGRMDGDEKARIMAAFRAAEVDVLVATTVIEVGVDVPNASIMVIENAERLGLSQLHQLRGRIGRGSLDGVCVLLYHAPLSALGRERLAVLRRSRDGFEIAQRDMELRGPGEVLGTQQAGHARFRLADLLVDQALIPQAAEAAREIMARYPERVPALLARWLGEDPLRYREV